jgi:hypothetical protein
MSWWHHLSLQMLACTQHLEFSSPRIFTSENLWFIWADIYIISFRVSNDYRVFYLFSLLEKCQYPRWRLIIEVHDYAWFSKKILAHCQWSYHLCLMTQDGHPHEMPKKNTFVSWNWTLGVKRSQAYPSFSCSKFTTHCTPGGCITVIKSKGLRRS